jgi:LytS/YehU family sensor histidine kinase
MSVQSLVENAVKHGIHPLPVGGEVTVTVAAANEALRISVRDTGPGFDLSSIPAGHGLDHLVSRLDALFGPKARLNVLREGNGTLVEIVLPRA